MAEGGARVPVGELIWDELHGEVITINEVEYRRIRLRLVPPPQPSTCYVFLGEGNFTFSTAFAKLRGSKENPTWDGIVATDIKIEDKYQKDFHPRMPRPQILDATNMGKDRADFLNRLNIAGQEPSRIVLWFQCPWTNYHKKSQAPFISDIMAAASRVQNPGELLLIGLCVDKKLPRSKKDRLSKYVTKYGNPEALAKNNGYERIGADQEFVGKMIDNGYEHQTSEGKSSGLERNNQFATLLCRRTESDPNPAQG